MRKTLCEMLFWFSIAGQLLLPHPPHCPHQAEWLKTVVIYYFSRFCHRLNDPSARLLDQLHLAGKRAGLGAQENISRVF